MDRDDRDYDDRWSEPRRERGWGYADAGGWGWYRTEDPRRDAGWREADRSWGEQRWRDRERERGNWPPYDDSYYDRPSYERPRRSGDWEGASGWFAGNEAGPRNWRPYNAPRASGPDRGYGAPWGDRDFAPPTGTPRWEESRRFGFGGHPERRPSEQGDWRGGPPWSEGDHGRWIERGSGHWGQGFAGRGPKGYRRSDDSIREEINERLTDAFDVDPHDVEVAVEKGEVTLRGTVTSRYAKRRVEHIADQVRGVEDVHNELRIAGPPLPPEEGVPEAAVRGHTPGTRPSTTGAPSEADGVEAGRR
jgi:hypothetical protein